MRFVGGVVDGDDDGKNPGEEGKDLVGRDGARAVRLSLAEGVIDFPRHDGERGRVAAGRCDEWERW
jgi:hypothetical protein